MFRAILLLFLLISISRTANATELQITIIEKRTNFSNEETKPVSLYFSFDTVSKKVHPIKSVSGKILPLTTGYNMKPFWQDTDNKFYYRGKVVAPADAILYQCEVDGFDFVLVDKQHNSFSSPRKLFWALMSHPDQVDEIIAYTVKDGIVTSSTLIYTNDPFSHSDYVATGWRKALVSR